MAQKFMIFLCLKIIVIISLLLFKSVGGVQEPVPYFCIPLKAWVSDRNPLFPNSAQSLGVRPEPPFTESGLTLIYMAPWVRIELEYFIPEFKKWTSKMKTYECIIVS